MFSKFLMTTNYACCSRSRQDILKNEKLLLKLPMVSQNHKNFNRNTKPVKVFNSSLYVVKPYYNLKTKPQIHM